MRLSDNTIFDSIWGCLRKKEEKAYTQYNERVTKEGKKNYKNGNMKYRYQCRN
jgi:hypothetical protein